MTTNLPVIHGRILDLDSHLQVPISRWGEVFGEATSRFGKRFAGIPLFDATDEPELTTESVWNTKGTAAPGASNPESRLAAMDVMGIDRQLIFPQVILAMPAWSDHPSAASVLHEYNDTVMRWTKEGRGRLRPTALLNLTTGATDLEIGELSRVVGPTGIDLTTDVSVRINKSVSAHAVSSFALPSQQQFIVRGSLGQISTEAGESFTTWNEACSLRIDDVVEKFAATNAFVEMVENVSQVIDGDDGWMVSSADSIRVAHILDQIARHP